jgi:hypothetical protein
MAAPPPMTLLNNRPKRPSLSPDDLLPVVAEDETLEFDTGDQVIMAVDASDRSEKVFDC